MGVESSDVSEPRQSVAEKRIETEPLAVEPSTEASAGLAPHTSVDHQFAADLDLREYRQGGRPGERYVRIVRPHLGKLRRVEPGHLVATEKTLEGRSLSSRLWNRLRQILFGRPLATAALPHERLTKVKALAVFASDALSSSAYATEEILLVLVAAGTMALHLTIPVAAAIAMLLTIVVMSYRQTIRAYPQGGGSYIVTKDNLGTTPSLVAAASLLTDYVLTVAVSISAGVAALTSAVPALHDHRVLLATMFIALIMIINLRGVRESGTIFAAPTYLFLIAAMAMLVAGGVRLVTGAGPASSVDAVPIEGGEALTIFLILRAFASGCAALTGTEAISDGVPAFKTPEWRNASTTLTWMAVILGVLFLGITVLANGFHIVPTEGETVVSQVARAAFGTSPIYYLMQMATMLILVLAANTSFSDFPRLSYFLARDRFMPHQFQFRGDRLAFSTGIVVLAALAIALVVIFQAETHALIPLYAIGVFISFTLSQASMVRRWWVKREQGWRRSMVVNGVGATTTGIVALVVAITKFPYGAWIILVLIPVLVFLLMGINRHYQAVRDQLTLERFDQPLSRQRAPYLVVPIDDLHRGTLQALSYARSISPNVVAVSVTDDMEAATRLRRRWERWGGEVPLVILESPYRSLIGPLLAYIDALHAEHPDGPITVVLPEFVPRRWWELLLHNQSALRIKAALFFRPNTVVVDVPFHLRR